MKTKLDALSQRAVRAVGSREDAKQAAEHGADAGWSNFTYYNDTLRFYNRNRKLIMEALASDASDYGITIQDMLKGFKCLKGVEDPVAVLVVGSSHEDFTTVANGMAWYALERAGHAIIASEEEG